MVDLQSYLQRKHIRLLFQRHIQTENTAESETRRELFVEKSQQLPEGVREGKQEFRRVSEGRDDSGPGSRVPKQGAGLGKV